MKPQPKVTIIVCTFNRAEILPYCLDSLVDQTASQDQYEVIVVNNNSSDGTRYIAEQYACRQANFRVVSESRQGLSHARNRGWMETETEWVAYIDDDAKAAVNCVERILWIIETHDFDCFGGLYEPWYLYGKPQWLKDSYVSNINNISKPQVLESGYASGGVMVVRRDLLERFGGFNIRFGMHGYRIAYGEETDLQERFRSHGYTIGFDPDLKIHHLVAKYKLNPWWFVSSSFRRSRDYNLLVSPEKRRSSLQIVRTLIHDSIYFFATSSHNLCNDDYYWQNWIIDSLSPAAACLGSLAANILISLQKSK